MAVLAHLGDDLDRLAAVRTSPLVGLGSHRDDLPGVQDGLVLGPDGQNDQADQAQNAADDAADSLVVASVLGDVGPCGREDQQEDTATEEADELAPVRTTLLQQRNGQKCIHIAFSLGAMRVVGEFPKSKRTANFITYRLGFQERRGQR